ncbi:unnamed protein product [Rotaria sp. Silwood2]|nr:unnamed protein product [Rotaria sp. Silwood2]CAF4436978.1 unnamed protein product [Rotaria sp. Silwood2]CAF4602505.1 unnamed protein product [Rotaria sp. Silwood2]
MKKINRNKPSRNQNPPYKDSDAKRQHDLYHDDDNEPTSCHSHYQSQTLRRGGRARFGRGGSDRHQQNYDERNDYCRRTLPNYKSPRDYDQYENNEQTAPPLRNQQRQQQSSSASEQTLHRERNFTNSQYQQRSTSKNNNDQRRSGG